MKTLTLILSLLFVFRESDHGTVKVEGRRGQKEVKIFLDVQELKNRDLDKDLISLRL